MTTKRTVTLPIEVDRQELLEAVMGAGWGTWEWWRKCKYAEGCDWETYPDDDTAPYATISIEDPDDTDKVVTKVVTVADIVRATAEAQKTCRYSWDNQDASSADEIMQIAVLGQVVYG